MILSDTEVITRLESPLNLMNRLRGNKTNAMDLFIPSRNSEPQLTDESIASILESIKDEPTDVNEDEAAKIKLGIVKARALDVLHDSLVMLGSNLGQVSKTEKLSTIARDMKNIIESDNEKSKNGSSNVVIYKPVINDISKYDTLVVTE